MGTRVRLDREIIEWKKIEKKLTKKLNATREYLEKWAKNPTCKHRTKEEMNKLPGFQIL